MAEDIFLHPKRREIPDKGAQKPPDTVAQHHPQCRVKTKRETEGDQESGGEWKWGWRRKEKRWKSVWEPCAVNRGCSGEDRGPLRARQQLQDSLTHTRARVDGNLGPLWGFIGVKCVDRWLIFSTVRPKIKHAPRSTKCAHKCHTNETTKAQIYNKQGLHSVTV